MTAPPSAASASTARPARAAAVRRPRSRRWDVVALVAIGVLAFLARFHMALHGGGLLGIGAYDDGVHYATAASLLHGRLPYRDVLFLQPPGIVLAATPFAEIGRLFGDPLGLQLFRIAFELVGAANAVLVALVLRRFGAAAAVTGGVFYAVFIQAVYDERTALLEPVGTLGVLVALLLLPTARRGGFWVAGAALGVACGFKIWYVVPALVVVAFARGGRLRVIGGAAVASAAIYLPFLLAAPKAMIDQVVLAQLGRPRSIAFPDFFSRAKVLLGVHGIKDPSPFPGGHGTALTLALVVLVALLVAVALATPGARIFAVLLVVDGAVIVAAPSFFAHYASLTAPPLALVLGVGVQRLVGVLRRRPLQVAAVLVVIAAVVALNARHDLARVDRRVPAAALQAAAARTPGCITSDDPTLLAVIGVLNRDLDHGCPLRADPSGYSFGPLKQVRGGRVVPRLENEPYQRAMLDYLLSGDAFLRVRKGAGLNPATDAALASHAALFHVSTFTLRRGDGTGSPR